VFRRYFTFLVLVALSGLVWYLNYRLPKLDLAKVFYSFLTVAAAYLLFKLVLEGLISRRIKDSKTRYSFRKTSQILFIVVSFIVILRIWVPNPQALLVAYGLVAAGVAIALQDVFKNFAGALAILLSGIYRVGDRIEINSKLGDVIDIGMFYTTLIELREWVDGDQTTGRIVSLPNGQVLNFPVHNYTKDHNFLWDEVALPITHDSNWKKAAEIIQSAVEEQTGDITRRAEQEISHLEQKYYLSKRNIEPAVFVTPTDNWIMLRIRYVVDVRERRLMRNELFRLILERIQQTPHITIASETLTVTNVASSAGKGQ
jgi:small-conductance mechanosensitive channel